MPLAKHFIEQGIKLMQINEYLRSELVRAGFAGVEVQNTPLGVRITLRTSRPGLVIGKGGKRIQEITEVLESRFGLEMPQIEVEEVQNPDIDAQIMAERLAYSLDRGRHYRRAGYYILRKVMDAGARGVEIIISGKVTSQRARTQIFRSGTMSKSGQPAQEAVDKGVAQCIMKTGVLGVIVKIMRANYKMGDGVSIKAEALQKAQSKISIKIGKTKAEELIEKEGLEIEEIERPLTDEEKELVDEVDEEDVSEISLEPKKDDDDEEKI
jgi:small subunit ribosomal protein S3